MVVLATVATVIASQSVISGAFSVTRQAVQLGYLPRMTIRHTSQEEIGQVYSPAINWGLYVAVLVLVLGFRSSASLASAYGVAVTGTFMLNTILFLVVARSIWRRPKWFVAILGVVFLTTELTFFAANLTKVAHGGWLPLLVAATVFTVLMTWQRGRTIVTRNRTDEEGSLVEFLDQLHEMTPPIPRVEGTAVFLNATIDTTPLALRTNVEHNHVLHQRVVILNIEVANVPHISSSERLSNVDAGLERDSITHLRAVYGFQDEPNVPATLRLAAEVGLIPAADLEDVTYFLSRITLVRSSRADHAALAEAAVPDDRAQLGQPGRVLRAAARELDQYGRADPGLIYSLAISLASIVVLRAVVGLSGSACFQTVGPRVVSVGLRANQPVDIATDDDHLVMLVRQRLDGSLVGRAHRRERQQGEVRCDRRRWGRTACR